jgi:hypothetical protein
MYYITLSGRNSLCIYVNGGLCYKFGLYYQTEWFIFNTTAYIKVNANISDSGLFFSKFYGIITNGWFLYIQYVIYKEFTKFVVRGTNSNTISTVGFHIIENINTGYTYHP